MDRRTSVVKEPPARPGLQPYSSKIIKAGALLADTKTLLSHWDTAATVPDNLDRMRRDNLFGKASRSRVEDILAVFRQRYLTEAEVVRALVVLVQGRLPAASLDRILYFHAARSDRLLHDVVDRGPGAVAGQGHHRHRRGGGPDGSLASGSPRGRRPANGRRTRPVRVAQGLLSTLRDFGVLQGAVNKRIAPAYLPVEAFAYVMFYLKQHQPSGAKLVELPDWKLFFLSREGVERFLFEAHQHDLLEYHAAGSVTRLTFPADTLEEYANVLAERSH